MRLSIHLAIGMLAVLLGAVPVAAATQAPFDQTALTAAQTANKPILIAVHAPWCPVCARQTPVIDALAATAEFKDLVILTIDFDSQKDLLKTFGVQKQSTLIVMHGKAERDRSTGVSDPDAIKTLLLKSKS